jgi:kynurenine formamidase
VTDPEFDAIAARVNTWGRWGDDDQRGMLNLVDRAAVQRGVASVVDGQAIPLSIPLGPDGIQAGLIKGRDNPTRRMTWLHSAPTGDPDVYAANDDVLELGTQVATHWDALAHVSHRGVLYNGAPTVHGHRGRCQPRRHRHRRPPGDPRDPAGRRPCAGRGTPGRGRRHRPGRTGPGRRGSRRHPGAGRCPAAADRPDAPVPRGDRVAYAFPSPGLTIHAVPWLHDHGIAAVATDTLTFEVFPRRDLGPNGEHFGVEDLVMPVHLLCLVEMGMLQGQNFDLEALADACAADGRHACLLSATPEPIVGGVGGPVAAVAIR